MILSLEYRPSSKGGHRDLVLSSCGQEWVADTDFEPDEIPEQSTTLVQLISDIDASIAALESSAGACD